MSLRVKLFAAFFTFIMLPLFGLGIAAYYFISDTLEENYGQQAEISLRALSQTAKFIFLEMNKVTDTTIASNAIQEVLNSTLYDEQDLTEIDYLALNVVQQNFRELLVNHPSVSFAFMYVLKDQRVIRLYTKDKFEALSFELFKTQPLYEHVLSRKGLPVWVGPFENAELTGYDHVFTQIRVVKDIDSLKDKGILLVQIKHSGLEDIFRYFQFKQEQYATQFFIAKANGLILFDSAGELTGSSIDAHLEQAYQPSPGFFSERTRFAGTDSILSSIPLGIEDWQLVSVASWSSLSKEINRYARLVVFITVLVIASAFIFLLFSVNRLVKTIIRIVRFMRRVENGELHIRIQESKSNDETQLLTRGLNSLTIRVQQLLDKVKQEQQHKLKAEMRVLQAQIKPHFLFNTLESINALAVQNEGRKVSQMVLRLASILRISFQGQEEISLAQEIEHLKHYLEIQKFRFEALFDYEMAIPPSLQDCSILKLTLQPLVENCIQHGFDGIEYRGFIRIEAQYQNGRVLLFVHDNGTGMTNETLARFQYMASDDGHLEAEKLHPNRERRGLGVRSVADRLRIEYGPGYGLFVCSERYVGTTILCVIPCVLPECELPKA